MAKKQSKKAAPAQKAALVTSTDSQKTMQASTSTAATTASATSKFDSELDAFFQTPAIAVASTPIQPVSEAGPSNSLKRKQKHQAQSDSDEDEDQQGAGDLSELSDDEEISIDGIDESEQDDEEDADMHAAHAQVSGLLQTVDTDDKSDDDDDDDDDSETESSRPALKDGYVPPVHESSEPGKSSGKLTKANHKFVEADEPAHLRNKRTLFLGNLPVEAAKNRSVQKKLLRFVESFSPYPAITKASNLRFRSVAFSVPTNNINFEDPDQDDDDEESSRKGKKRERAQNYREAVAAVESGEKGFQSLTAKQKRKIAFINKNIHDKAETVSAYVTIGHPQAVVEYLQRIAPPTKQTEESQVDQQDPSSLQAKSRVTIEPRLTAPVLAALIAAYADGQVFQDRHIRVDLTTALEASEVVASGLDKVITVDGSMAGSVSTAIDPKRTLFVGNLDFESSEEQVREFFEKLMREERGTPESASVPLVGLDGKPPSEKFLQSLAAEFPWLKEEKKVPVKSIVRQGEWVRSVRVVRDQATQMGKGFAYVRFIDQQCVDEVIAIHQTEEASLESLRGGSSANGKGLKGSLAASAAIAVGGKEFKRRLKFRSRPLRVSRCKVQTKSSPSYNNRSAKRGKHDHGNEPPSTPVRKDATAGGRRYERSTGAPTPNGTSPHALKAQQHGLPPIPASPLSSSKESVEQKAQLYASLSKDERKQLKKQDQERVQKRLAKAQNKKNNKTMGKGSSDRKSLLLEAEKAKRKEKVRLRQPPSGSGAKGKGGSGSGSGFKGKSHGPKKTFNGKPSK